MFKQGDIVLIPVPYSDLTNKKQRPVLVISNDDYNKMTEDLVVVAITSAIRADKVYTLSKDIVRKKFGEVNFEVLEGVRTKINELLK